MIHRIVTDHGVVYRYSIWMFTGRGSHFKAYSKMAHMNMIHEDIRKCNNHNRKIVGK